MKYIIVICLWAVSLFASNTLPQKNASDNIVYMKLDNGLQIYLLNDAKAETTRVRLRVGVGFDDATDKTYGISHLVEHLVFRDHRVPHSDYLDYMSDEGATDVNGYTKRYETDYVATIAEKKSDWLVQTFAKMLFNKDLNNEDLRIEKEALQTEIGEPHWFFKPFFALKHFFEFIAPPKEDFYQQQFSLPKTKELPDNYHAQENNRNFTLQALMQRYRQYYYPANMTLFVAGKFNTKQMLNTIQESFGTLHQTGTKSIHEPHYKAKLNQKPFARFFEGVNKNYAFVGAKYVLDNYKKYLILDVYINSLAKRLEQKMRNKLGKTYSVNAHNFGQYDARIIAVSFDGLTDTFSDNIVIAKSMIQTDRQGLSPEMIKKALALYEKKNYLSLEHDSQTLLNLLDIREYLRKEQNITTKSSYAVFQSITPKEFNQTLFKVLAPQNAYTYVTRNYYFFPMDVLVITLSSLALMILIYILLVKYDLKKKGLTYIRRDIIFQRRISSRFIGFLLISFTYLFAAYADEWLIYLFSKWITGNPFYLRTIDVPQSYLVTTMDIILFIFLFFTIYRNLWHYWAKIDVLKEKIIVKGNHVMSIPKEQISQMHIVKPNERKDGKTFGIMLRFWKPLLKIDLKDNKHYYIRTTNAVHLQEDLQHWLEKD